MKLENQVCSLDLAKRLKDLGVKQESCFYWADYGESQGLICGNDMPIDHQTDHYYHTDLNGKYAAFTVAELGEMMPHLSKCWRTRENKWGIEYVEPLRPHNITEITRRSLEADTEADARAKMLIYLIEQGLVKP